MVQTRLQGANTQSIMTGPMCFSQWGEQLKRGCKTQCSKEQHHHPKPPHLPSWFGTFWVRRPESLSHTMPCGLVFFLRDQACKCWRNHTSVNMQQQQKQAGEKKNSLEVNGNVATRTRQTTALVHAKAAGTQKWFFLQLVDYFLLFHHLFNIRYWLCRWCHTGLARWCYHC